MLDFFQLFFEEAPDNSMVQWGSPPPGRFLYPTVEEILSGAALTDRPNLYFGPAFRRIPTGEKSGVLGSFVAWVDADWDEDKHETWRPPLVPPTVVVASGGSNRFHFYWRLSKMLEPDELEFINKKLAAHMGADKCWNSNRIMRVPGSTNTKYDEPKPVVIREFHPERVYDPRVLSQVRPYDPRIWEIQEKHTRSERDWHIASLLKAWGYARPLAAHFLSVLSDKVQDEGGEDGHYLTVTLDKIYSQQAADDEENKSKTLGNVTFEALAHLQGADGEDRGLVIALHWEGGSKRIAATQENFKSRRDIITLLSTHSGTLTWHGSDLQAIRLWENLVSTVPQDSYLLGVEAAGRYTVGGQGIFIYDDSSALTLNGSQPDVIWTPKLRAKMSVVLDLADTTPGELEELMGIILNVHDPEVVLPSLGWVAASVVKPLFDQADIAVPLLMLYGFKGSGKSTLIRHVFLPVVGVHRLPISADITPFALTAYLSTSNAIPVWINEYRADLSTKDLDFYLRTLYDRATVDKGRPDLSVTSYTLTAPIVIDGESPLKDSATRDRAISLHVKADRVDPGTPANRAYRKLRKFPVQARASLARQYLQWTLGVSGSDVRELWEAGEDIFIPYRFGARASSNAAVIWTGLQLYRQFLESVGVEDNLPSDKVEPIAVAMGATYVPGLGVRTPVEAFCELVAHQFKIGASWMTPNCVWDKAEGVLWFNVTNTHHYLRAYWPQCPDKDLLAPQLQDRTRLYLRGPKTTKSGAIMYGLVIARAQALGLDVPTPPDRSGPLNIDMEDVEKNL